MSSLKRKLSENASSSSPLLSISSNNNESEEDLDLSLPSEPPNKKMKYDDKNKTIKVVIGNKTGQFEASALAGLPYFEATLSEKWKSNKSNDTIVISDDETLNFSLCDLSNLVSNLSLNCADPTDIFFISEELVPEAQFLSFIHCANFFCVKVTGSAIKDYYENCNVLIDNKILNKWKESGIEKVVQFAIKELKSRNDKILKTINKNIKNICINMKWGRRTHCDQAIMSNFAYIIKLFLSNYSNESDLDSIIVSLCKLAKRVEDQTCVMEKLHVSTNQAVEIMALLLEILLDFTKNDQWFDKLQESVISLMLKFCDTFAIKERFNSKVKNLWSDISVFIFKTKAYQNLIESVYFEGKGLWIFIEDENIMKQIFEVINNRNGVQLATTIIEWNMNNASKQTKYDEFCSKYFNPIKQ